MPKTLVDVDEKLLERAAEALHTGTKKETITNALREVVITRSRVEELDWWAEDPLPDLRDPEVMDAAWR